MAHLLPLRRLNKKFLVLFFLLISLITFEIARKLGDEGAEGSEVGNGSLTHRSDETGNLSRSSRSPSQRETYFAIRAQARESRIRTAGPVDRRVDRGSLLRASPS